MTRKDFHFLFSSFVLWRVLLFLIVFISPYLFPLQDNFLGGGMQNYLSAPWAWGWANFDGEHYLAIAQRGYRHLEHFYFPIYPVLVGTLAKLFNNQLITLLLSGLIISNLAFFVGLIGFYKIIKLDFSEKVIKLAIILLLVFPTSFYFGSVYTESLFFALVVWSFYFARKKHWLLAGTLGAVVSATRVIGIVLLPALVIEYITSNVKYKKSIVWLLLIPAGLGIYMFYLYKTTGDPLEFLHTIALFGTQRSPTVILLPQVFYRYIFKILPNLSYNYFPVVFTTLLEFSVASVFSLLSVTAFCRFRPSYAIYLAGAFLIPTFSGSFSSLPRYVLVLFPGFLLMALFISKLPKILQVLIFTILFISLVISTSMFVRGLWIA